MATYTMTPQERRARALALREQRQNRVLYRNALRENATKTVSQPPVQAETPAKEPEEQNFLVRALMTADDFVGNVITGAVKGLEGIVDLGIGAVGAIGGIFSKDFQDTMKNAVAYDFAGEMIGNPLSEWSKGSYLNDGEVGRFFENVGQGIGQMLPAIVVTVATAGAGAPAAVAAMGGYGGLTMAASAAGNATEEAFNDGAEYYRGLGYGVASGAVEAATEKIGGRVLGGGTSAVGKAIAGTALGNAVQKGVGKVAYDFVSEGAEEVLADVVNPTLKSIYKGKDAFSEYTSPEFYQKLPETFLVGGTVGSAMGGAQTTLRSSFDKNVKERGGRRALAADEAMTYISEVTKNYGTDAQKNARYDLSVDHSLDRISENLQAMSESERTNYLKYIERTPLRLAFDETGKKIAMAVDSSVSADAISGSVRAVGGNLEYNATTGAVSESAKMVKDTIESIFKNNVGIVVTDKLAKDQRAAYDAASGVFYINNTMEFDSDFTEKMTAIHEVMHSAEGTEEYTKVIAAIHEFVKAFPSQADALQNKIDLSNIESKYHNPDASTTENMYVTDTEINADVVARLLGSDEYVSRLANRDAGLVKKLYAYFTTAHDKTASKAARKSLKKICDTFGKAIDNSRGGVMLSSFRDEERGETAERASSENPAAETAETVDEHSEMRYNKTYPGTEPQYTQEEYDRFGWARANDILSAQESERLRSLFAAAVSKHTKPPRTKAGEYMFAVGENVDNKIVYMKGTIAKPVITRVLEIIEYDETNLDKTRRNIYDIERRGIQQTPGEVIYTYNRASFAGYDATPRSNSTSQQSDSQFGIERGTSSGTAPKAESGVQRPFLPVVHTFTDIAGNKRNVVRISPTEYMIENDSRSKYQPSIEAAVNAENERILQRYARTSGHTVSWTRSRLAEDPSFLRKERRSNFRSSLTGNSGEGTSLTRDDSKHKEGHAPYKSELSNFRSSFKTSKSGMANDALLAYDDELSRLIKQKGDLIVDSFDKLEEIVNLAFDDPQRKATAYFGIINAETLEKIKNSIPNLPKDLEETLFKKGREYSVAATLDSIRHMVDDKNLTREDVLDYLDKFADTILEFDSVSFSFYDGGNGEARGLLFRKTFQDGTYISFDLVSNKKKSVVLQSLYMDQADYEKKKSAKTLLLQNATASTPEVRAGRTSTNSIPQSNDSVNRKNSDDSNFRFSRTSTSDTVTMSKGEMQKRKANYESDRVYSKAEVANAINSIKGFENVPSSHRNSLINDIWKGLNSHYSPEQRKQYIEMMGYRSKWVMLQEASSVLDNASQEEIHAIEREIHSTLKNLVEHGKPSIKSKLEAEFNASDVGFWKEQHDIAVLQSEVLHEIRMLREKKLGTFLNASQFKSDIFNGSIGKLTGIDHRGKINKSGTRKILAGLAEWYNIDENPLLNLHAREQETKVEATELYSEDISIALEALAKGEGDFTYNELLMLKDVLVHFKHIIENYNKVWHNGKQVEAETLAKDFVRITQENKGVKDATLRNFLEGYLVTFGDPMTVARYMDRYSNGFFTQMFEAFRKGTVNAAIMEMEIRAPLEEFYKKNKRFQNDLLDKTVEYFGQQIPLGHALMLYMTLNREQALPALAENGFAFFDNRKKGLKKKDTTRDRKNANGFAPESELTVDELRSRAERVQKDLAKQFTETEMQYISIVEKIFNSDCKEAKRATDMLLRGFSNVLEGYYVPIRRADTAHSIESSYRDEMGTISRASFNKSMVEGAKNKLLIESIDVVLDRHIRGVCQYANLALPIETYNRIYNFDVGGNPNNVVSVKTESIGIWKNGEQYLTKIISDIQGRSPLKNDYINKGLRKVRSGYAKYQLGLNPKVWITQLSSFAAAGNILDVDCIIKGMGISASDVNKYCALAKLRNTENTTALAQGVLETTGKVGDFFMKPIGWVDGWVIGRLFGACQLQVEKNGGPKVGTTENKTKAGELLEKVILETQQNALATEKSAAARSENEFAKALTMFYSDAMKLMGRVIDGVGEVAVLKAKRKLATDAKEIAAIDEKIKKANKKALRAVGSLAASAVFQALVAQLFRTLYAKDDEDEDIAKNMATDAVGNLLGGLPFIRDIYSRFAEGYEFDGYSYSMINDTLDSAEKIFTLAGNVFEGNFDSRELASTTKSFLYSAGQIFGMPTRNVYNMAYGLTKRLSPSAAYSIDDMFYKQSYRSDLAKAVEKGDDKMIATITGLMLNENVGGISDKGAREALDSLVQKGYDVIPRSVNSTVTYDGEEYELTAAEEKHFEEIYSVANEALADLVKLSQYADASDEVQAKAVNFIYDVYYKLALQDYLGIELETKSVLFAEAIDIEKLALIVSTAKALTADTDNTGKAITGSKKRKIQAYVNSLKMTAAEKYMIMGYLGYTNTNGEAQVKAYINRLKLTKAEKAKLLVYSGYSN